MNPLKKLAYSIRAVALAACAALAPFAWADCPTIDFENLAVGTAVTNQYSGVTFSVAGQSCSDSPTLYMRVYAPTGGTSSGTKAIKIDTGCPDFSSDYLRIVFTLPQREVSFTIGDWGGRFAIRYYTTTSGSGLIGSFTVTNSPGAGDLGVHRRVTVTSSTNNIRRIEVQDSVGLWEAIDDLTYNIDDTAPVAQITTPAQLACVCSGITIEGSAYDPDGPISNWILDRKAIGATTWTLILSGTTEKTNESLSAWYPATSATDGYYTLRLRVRNACGIETAWTTDVYLNRALNDFGLRSPTNNALLGGTVCADGTVWDHCDGVFILERRPVAGGAWVAFDSINAPWVINDNLGSWNTRAVADGSYSLRLIGSDGCTNTATNQITITVDNTAPLAAITAPVPCATRTGIIPVRGTASDAHLDRWLLQYSGGATHGWVNIATGYVNVVNGLLGNWDTTSLAPCAYALRLLVTDQSVLDCNGALRNQAEYTTALHLVSDPLGQDTDADGMPDLWETTYSFNINNPADAALDADGDGLSNLAECLAGTNPREAGSLLRITKILRDTNESRITWTTVGSHNYLVQGGTNVTNAGGSVSPLISVPPGGESTKTYVHTNVSIPTYYYQIRLAE